MVGLIMLVVHEHRSHAVTARAGTVEFTISNFGDSIDPVTE
jgi:hypothetical protein